MSVTQRAQSVKRRFKAMLQLFGHVLLHPLQRHVAGAFNHHLNIVLPRFGGELAQGVQFAELRFIVGIGNAARAQAVAQRKRQRRRLS